MIHVHGLEVNPLGLECVIQQTALFVTISNLTLHLQDDILK